MDDKEFLEEIQKYVFECYQEFLEYQNIAKDILYMFHDLCIENNIQYYLAFGTLIGSVRDNGLIPWDYDVDVVVPYKDYNKLIEVLNNKLINGYYYTYYNNTENYPTSCLRICKEGYSFIAIHIDVYFLIGCPDNKYRRDKFLKSLDRASYFRALKFSPKWFPKNYGGNILRKILQGIDIVRSKLIYSGLYNNEIKFMDKFKFGSTKYCYIVGDLKYKKVYETKWFSDTEEVLVDDHLLFIPIGYENILKEVYGEYKTYFPIENRFNEFYDFLYIIRERNKNYNYNKNKYTF